MSNPPAFFAMAEPIHLNRKAKTSMAVSDLGPLVTADWLKDNLKNPNVRVFEVSVDPGVYERGHIAGAVNLDWHVDLVDTVNRDIASREKLETTLRKSGVAADTAQAQ